MEKRLHAVPPPPFVQRMKDESRAIEAESVQTALDAVPPRDLERLRQQLTPLAKRPFVAEDRHEYTRIIQEWGMRGLPDYAPTMLMEKLYDEHRAEREPKAGPLRRHFEQIYAPWFAPEPRPENPGLQVVSRSQWRRMDTFRKAGAVADVLMSASHQDSTRPTFISKLRRALHL